MANSLSPFYANLSLLGSMFSALMYGLASYFNKKFQDSSNHSITHLSTLPFVTCHVLSYTIMRMFCLHLKCVLNHIVSSANRKQKIELKITTEVEPLQCRLGLTYVEVLLAWPLTSCEAWRWVGLSEYPNITYLTYFFFLERPPHKQKLKPARNV